MDFIEIDYGLVRTEFDRIAKELERKDSQDDKTN